MSVSPTVEFEGALCFGLTPDTLQRQWFVLEDDALVYYNQQQEPRTQEGTLPLEGCAVSMGASSLKFCFELKIDSKTYFMVADDGMQLQEWMTHIRKISLRIRRQRTTSLTKKNPVERRNFAQEAAEALGDRVGLDAAQAAQAQAPMTPEPKPAEDRLGLYKQWLEETKAKGAKAGENSPNALLHRQLLSESENMKVQRKGCCGKACKCCSPCCCSVS